MAENRGRIGWAAFARDAEFALNRREDGAPEAPEAHFGYARFSVDILPLQVCHGLRPTVSAAAALTNQIAQSHVQTRACHNKRDKTTNAASLSARSTRHLWETPEGVDPSYLLLGANSTTAFPIPNAASKTTKLSPVFAISGFPK